MISKGVHITSPFPHFAFRALKKSVDSTPPDSVTHVVSTNMLGKMSLIPYGGTNETTPSPRPPPSSLHVEMNEMITLEDSSCGSTFGDCYIIDGSYGTRAALRGCLKVKTQVDSLAVIAQSSELPPVPKPTPERKLVKFSMRLKAKTQYDSFARVARSSELLPVPERTPEPKLVNFATVEFREYARTLSDNPSTSSGAPIGIGWRYDPKDTTTVDLDLFERSREGIRRDKGQLLIPRDLRERMLREAGFSSREILEAVRKVQMAKKQRSVSLQQLKFGAIIEMVESLTHVVRSFTSKRRFKIDSFPSK
jgi:hypothetical protein